MEERNHLSPAHPSYWSDIKQFLFVVTKVHRTRHSSHTTNKTTPGNNKQLNDETRNVIINSICRFITIIYRGWSWLLRKDLFQSEQKRADRTVNYAGYSPASSLQSERCFSSAKSDRKEKTLEGDNLFTSAAFPTAFLLYFPFFSSVISPPERKAVMTQSAVINIKSFSKSKG